MSEQPERPRENGPGDPSALPLILSPLTEAARPDPRIEDYLDHVCAPLIGVVPYARRQELRAELREHLAAMAAAQQEMGSEPEAAVVMALRQFGEPRDLARQWAQEWQEGSGPSCVELPWQAMRTAFLSFSLTTLIALTLMLAEAPSDSRLFWDVGPPVWLTVICLLPLLAGLTTGFLAPARHALGTFYALAVIAALGVVAFGAGTLIAGSGGMETLVRCWRDLTLVQSLGWVPLGCGAAALGGKLRQWLLLRPRRWVLQ